MNFDIRPNEGVGELRFGMPVVDVRKIAGTAFESFKRGPREQHPIDYYHHIGLFCNYSMDGFLESLQFCEPAHPTLDGVDLMAMTLLEAKAFIRSLDGEVEVDIETATDYRMGVGVWSSRDDDEPIETVIAFVPGYYERYGLR